MLSINPVFAATESTSKESGIAALGINLKSFLFQLVAFLIVLLILKKYVFPKLIATLEARRETLEESLIQAKKTEEALASAEKKVSEILSDARSQADNSLSDAKKAAAEVVASAEAAAAERAQHIIKDAELSLADEREKLRSELKGELADLVALATEKVLNKKIDAKTDMQLIADALKETK